MENTNREHFWSKVLDPLTIIHDRYEGCYSGGKFLAFPMSHWEIPDGVDDGDFECRDFWRNFDGYVGRGNTVQEALDDLIKVMDSLP